MDKRFPRVVATISSLHITVLAFTSCAFGYRWCMGVKYERLYRGPAVNMEIACDIAGKRALCLVTSRDRAVHVIAH